MLQGENSCFFDKKFSKSSLFNYMQPGIYPCITDIAETMNTLIQERHNHSESCITVGVSQRTQKVKIYLANEHPGLAVPNTVWAHIFGSTIGKEIGVMSRGKGPHKPEFAYDIPRIQVSHDIHEPYSKKYLGRHEGPVAPLFPFYFKTRGQDIITTGEYMNYQTFSNLQFKPLLEKSFHSIHIDLRDTSGEKISFVSVGITRLALMFKKSSHFHC